MHDTAEDKQASAGKCPVLGHTAAGAAGNLRWWPNPTEPEGAPPELPGGRSHG